MSYLASEKVKVFPTAYRGEKAKNPDASLNTEFNITNIVNRLVDRKSFVVSYDNDIMVCCIYGYWFELNLSGETRTPLYASILIKKPSYESATDFRSDSLAKMSDGTVTTLDVELSENNWEFEGLDLTDTAPSESADGSLKILQLLDANGNVPEENWIKLTANKIGNDDNSGLPISRNISVDINESSTAQTRYGIEIKNGETLIEKTTREDKVINVPVTIKDNDGLLIIDGSNNIIEDTDNTKKDINVPVTVVSDYGVTIKNEDDEVIEQTDNVEKTINVPTEINGNLDVIGDHIYLRGKAIAKKDSNDKFVWWVDERNNVYQLNGKPQNTLVTLSKLQNALITWNGAKYEADWLSNEGVRKYCVSSTLDDNGFTQAVVDGAKEYQKVNIDFDENNRLVITY